jgi:hypothetical protein
VGIVGQSELIAVGVEQRGHGVFFNRETRAHRIEGEVDRRRPSRAPRGGPLNCHLTGEAGQVNGNSAFSVRLSQRKQELMSGQTLGAALVLAMVFPGSVAAQFPGQALGYAVDAAPDASCLAAGGTWTTDHAGNYGRCTVAPSGHAGRTAVTFCQDGLPCTVSFGTAGAVAVAAWRDLVAPVVEQFHGSYGPRVDMCVREFIADPSSSRASCRSGSQQGAAAIEIQGGMFLARLYLSSNPAHSHVTVTYISPRNRSDFRTSGGASSDSVALQDSTRGLAWAFGL